MNKYLSFLFCALLVYSLTPSYAKASKTFSITKNKTSPLDGEGVLFSDFEGCGQITSLSISNTHGLEVGFRLSIQGKFGKAGDQFVVTSPTQRKSIAGGIELLDLRSLFLSFLPSRSGREVCISQTMVPVERTVLSFKDPYKWSDASWNFGKSDKSIRTFLLQAGMGPEMAFILSKDEVYDKIKGKKVPLDQINMKKFINHSMVQSQALSNILSVRKAHYPLGEKFSHILASHIVTLRALGRHGFFRENRELVGTSRRETEKWGGMSPISYSFSNPKIKASFESVNFKTIVKKKYHWDSVVAAVHFDTAFRSRRQKVFLSSMTGTWIDVVRSGSKGGYRVRLSAKEYGVLANRDYYADQQDFYRHFDFISAFLATNVVFVDQLPHSHGTGVGFQSGIQLSGRPFFEWIESKGKTNTIRFGLWRLWPRAQKDYDE